jgi:predicted dehydrogenase
LTDLAVGVVGNGVMGKRHLAVLRDRSDVRVIEASDVAAEADPKSFRTEWVDALVAGGAGAVIVATPATTHRTIVERCLELGVHVLVEKPLAANISDAAAMALAAENAERNGLVVAVGHVERFSPALADVTVTDHSAIRTRRAGPRPVRIRDVGVLLDLAVHDVDLVRFLTGREYRSAAVEVDIVDAAGVDLAASITGILDDGTSVTHEVSWCEQVTTRLLVIGDRSVDLILVDRTAAVTAQDAAFLNACLGGERGFLARAADGLAALSVITQG